VALERLYTVRVAGFRDEPSRERVLEFLSLAVTNKTSGELLEMLNALPFIVAENVTEAGLPMLAGGLESRGALVDVIPTSVVATPSPEEEVRAPGGVPWENRGEKSLLGALWRTWSGSLFGGRAFYSALPEGGSIISPVAYATLMWMLSMSLALPLTMSQGMSALGAIPVQFDFRPYMARAIIASIILAPFYIPLVYAMGAGMFHLFLCLLGAKGGYEKTLRVLAYSSSCSAFQCVPVVGLPIMWWYMLYLVVTGFSSTHRIGTGRALVAAVAPVLLLVIAGAGAAFVVAWAIGQSAFMGRFQEMVPFN
jgi:hypothetical protein